MSQKSLTDILTDKGLAQFGDSLLNFAYSLALTEISGEPRGTKVQDKILAEAAVKAGLRRHLPRRVGRGDVANGFEALMAHAWLEKLVTLDEIVTFLKTDSLSPSNSFAQLAALVLARLKR